MFKGESEMIRLFYVSIIYRAIEADKIQQFKVHNTINTFEN